MADELDAMLQGTDTPSVSPAENDGQADARLQQQLEEEVAFNSLSGSTQDRVRELWREKKAAEERAAFLEQQRGYIPPAPQSAVNPDQQQAVETLAKFGIATDDKVQQKINESFNVLRWDMENQRLENKYPGTGKLPKYDRGEVEDYIRTHPQYAGYSPEDVFQYKMYPDEFRNEDMPSSKGRSQTLRPTKQIMTSSEINPDNVEEMVRTHSAEWYDEHIDEINRAVGGWTKQFNNQGERV